MNFVLSSFRKLLIGSFAIILLLFCFSPSAFAQSYGEGTYGSGVYGGGSGFSALGAESLGASTGDSTCTAKQPSSPDLFRVDTTNTTATLYIKPVDKPVTSYLVSFGTTAESEVFGGSFNPPDQSGTIRHTINGLRSDTTYYFKVRADNDCASSNWSQTVQGKTTSSQEKVDKHYKNIFTQITQSITSLFQKEPTDSPSETYTVPKDTLNTNK